MHRAAAAAATEAAREALKQAPSSDTKGPSGALPSAYDRACECVLLHSPDAAQAPDAPALTPADVSVSSASDLSNFTHKPATDALHQLEVATGSAHAVAEVKPVVATSSSVEETIGRVRATLASISTEVDAGAEARVGKSGGAARTASAGSKSARAAPALVSGSVVSPPPGLGSLVRASPSRQRRYVLQEASAYGVGTRARVRVCMCTRTNTGMLAHAHAPTLTLFARVTHRNVRAAARSPLRPQRVAAHLRAKRSLRVRPSPSPSPLIRRSPGRLPA